MNFNSNLYRYWCGDQEINHKNTHSKTTDNNNKKKSSVFGRVASTNENVRLVKSPREIRAYPNSASEYVRESCWAVYAKRQKQHSNRNTNNRISLSWNYCKMMIRHGDDSPAKVMFSFRFGDLRQMLTFQIAWFFLFFFLSSDTWTSSQVESTVYMSGFFPCIFWFFKT